MERRYGNYEGSMQDIKMNNQIHPKYTQMNN